MPGRGELPLLFYGNSYHNPDIYQSMRFLAPDPIIALEDGDERIIVASALEKGRAEKESRATQVRDLMEFGFRELAAQGIEMDEINAVVIQRFLGGRGLSRVSVPRFFPLGLGDALRRHGVELELAKDLALRRRTKRDDEIKCLETAQRATEEAWQEGVDAIRRA